MKQKDNIDQLFDRLQGDFDFHEPETGHEARFLEKLDTKTLALTPKRKSIWKPFLGIAASITLLVSLFVFTQKDETTKDLASVSPEMQQTQDFFTTSINAELKKLDAEKSPETLALIEDALKQINLLESEYQKLKTDLYESGNDQRVIYAMIGNFQNRIDILNTVMEQIETIKQLKNLNTNENSITL
ncbi:MAG: hypothetical protein R2802_04305 [Flavobacteriaceae bacterium]|nr:hypothetical protein [Mangrovimonas sp.]HRV55336.1 hypothetical protein [Mangrovimonas sp.]